jgi:polysaccharide biosynthesis/export protein
MKLKLLLVLTIIVTICFLTLNNNKVSAQLPFIPPPIQSSAQAPTLNQPALSQSLPVQSGVTPQQGDALQRLSQEQRSAADRVIQERGGALTPEAIEALKSKPEFKGLKPEDVIKGKEILDKKDAGKTPPPAEKKVITGEAEGKTLFDRMRNIGAYQDISIALKPFGYEFFRDAAIRVVTDSKDIPVPSQYVIGPGDEVRILLWGRVNAQHNLIVDRNGNITIPQIGPVPVAGMTFENMSKQLIKQSEQIVGANIDITMGALKTIPIFVLGDVKRPGAYTIGSFSTMTDALLIAGGPTDIGSMRNVQLRRKEKTFTTFDLYDLFLKGDKSKDIILQAGDVVFVPVSGPIAGIAGNVKRPAIYELKNQFDLQTLFDLAGGIMPTAYTQQIQVERIIKTERQLVVDINDKDLTKAKHFTLQDADLIKVFNIVDKEANVVFLYGNVKRPGKYEFKPGMCVKDLVKNQSELLPETYFDYALIKRMEPPHFEARIIPINLKNLFSSDEKTYNIELKPMDTFFIFSKWFFKDRPYITVEGEVRGIIITDLETSRLEELRKPLPGMGNTVEVRPNELRRSGFANIDEMRFGDLRAKGIIEVDEKKVDELRKAGVSNIDDIKLGELRKQGMLSYLGLDESKLYGKKKPAEIALKGNMTVKDAILAAGGLTKDAYLYEAELYRTDEITRSVSLRRFSLKKAMDGDIENDITLKDKDRIVIHSIWGYVYKKTVAIDGEVYNPGTYQYAENMTVRDLVFSAGNVLDSAYLNNADISFQEVEDGKIAKVEHRQIDLKKALEGDPENNLVLKPYSRLFVKRITEWRREQFVNILGETSFPGKYIIKKGETLSSVIERAGGYTEKAYMRGAVFTRLKVKDLQQKTLNESIRRLEKELMAESTLRLSTAISAEEVAGLQAQQLGTQKLVDSLRRTEITGRTTIRLAHLRLLKGSEYDIELEDGDSLYIPSKNNIVNVSGAVMAQGSYLYTDALNYRDYIDKAGGYTRYADEKNIFVLKVDGSAMRIAGGFFNWNSSGSRWEIAGFGDEIKTIEPGDTIVIPEKLQATAWLRGLKDITQVLAQVGIFASSINYLFK